MRGRFLLPALLTLGACVLQRPTRRLAPRPAVTAEERVEADKAYYLAVSAYSQGEFARARELLRSVQKLDPSHAGARTLREKLDAADKAIRASGTP